MNKTILESVDNLLEEVVKRVRGGKIVNMSDKQSKRPAGGGWKFNKQSNNWERMTAADRQMRSKAALKGSKTRSKDTFGKEQALKKRQKSVKMGTNKGIYTKYPKGG